MRDERTPEKNDCEGDHFNGLPRKKEKKEKKRKKKEKWPRGKEQICTN